MKTIYNVAVLMDSQEQCDRVKQLCLDNGLPIWKHKYAFIYIEEGEVFGSVYDSNIEDNEFFVFRKQDLLEKTLITEAEFIELLKQEKA
jgi:hypothetical protein